MEARCTIAAIWRTLTKESMNTLLGLVYETLMDLEIPFEPEPMNERVCIYFNILLN